VPPCTHKKRSIVAPNKRFAGIGAKGYPEFSLMKRFDFSGACKESTATELEFYGNTLIARRGSDRDRRVTNRRNCDSAPSEFPMSLQAVGMPMRVAL